VIFHVCANRPVKPSPFIPYSMFACLTHLYETLKCVIFMSRLSVPQLIILTVIIWIGILDQTCSLQALTKSRWINHTHKTSVCNLVGSLAICSSLINKTFSYFKVPIYRQIVEIRSADGKTSWCSAIRLSSHVVDMWLSLRLIITTPGWFGNKEQENTQPHINIISVESVIAPSTSWSGNLHQCLIRYDANLCHRLYRRWHFWTASAAMYSTAMT